MTTLPHNTFPSGTFRPENNINSKIRLLINQTRFETLAILRNSEQLLLTIIIPAILLIVLTTFSIGNFDKPRVDVYLTVCLAVAIMSSGFTGQAIAVAFDRRYGVLKWLGTTALPKWNIIAAKCAAVANTIVLQCALLWGIAFFLGWRPTVTSIVTQIIFVFLGALAFTALGFLLGGTLKSEIVLGLANLLWFVFVMMSSTIIYRKDSLVATIVSYTPPGALTAGLSDSSTGINIQYVIILVCWIAALIFTTKKLFRYTA